MYKKMRSMIAFMLVIVMTMGSVSNVFADNGAAIIQEEQITVSPTDGEEGLSENSIVEEISENSVSESELSSDASDYTLTSEQKQDKMDLSAVLNNLAGLKAGVDYMPEQVYFEAEDKEEASEIADTYDAELESFEEGIGVLSVPEDSSVVDMVTIAADMDNQKPAVYPDYICEISEEEEIEYGSEEYPTELTDSKQYHHDTINTSAAWKVSKGSGVKVAVIDTGISTKHPNLKNNYDSSNSKAFGRYGKIEDPHGHGSHVAGLIAATNSNGVCGVAPQAKIYMCGVADNSSGTFAMSNAIKATKFATSKKVDVINMSFGSSQYDSVFADAVKAAIDSGAVVVVAAGNEHSNLNSNKKYPACFSNVITVSSTDKDGSLSDFSNYGSKYIDIAAPGGKIYSTYKNAGYATMSGTSMSSPIVAGVAALIIGSGDVSSKKGAARASAVRKLMRTCAKDKNDTAKFGAGIVNVGKCLSAVGITTKGGASGLASGETLQCAASIAGVTWTSSDSKLATVDAKGKITAGTVKKKKQVVITAKKDKRKGTIKLYIYPEKVKKIYIGDGTTVTKSINLSTLDSKTKKQTLIVWTDPVADELVEYSIKSSNDKIAKATANGKKLTVTAAGKKGDATITIQALDGSKKKAKLKVHVVVPVTKITMKNKETGGYTLDTYPIAQGKTIKISASADKEATNRKLIWTNEQKDSYTFKNGKLTCSATAKIGTKITVQAVAADGLGAKGKMTFVVKAPTESLVFSSNGKNKATLVMSPYSSTSASVLQYKISPSNAYSKSALIISKNSWVARYIGDTIKSGPKGTSKIVVQAVDGTKKKAVLTVKVK